MVLKQKKGGRPRLERAEKKKYRVVLKVNTRDYYMLKAKAVEAGLKVQAFLRSSIHSTSVVARLQPEEVGYIRQLSGMANNLNQLTYKANAGGYPEDASKYSSLADNISKIIKRINNVRKSNG